MAQCLTPYGVKDKIKQQTINVPCGKCPECHKRRISAWSFRLMEEAKRSVSAVFITLTYDTAYVPITRNGFMGLDKKHVQDFFKRLRKAHTSAGSTNPPIKYYLAGEYGGRTMRPHYHAILFNAELKLIQPAWNMGQIHYGSVEGASIGYTLKYISKVSKVPLHRNDDRLREFSLMSKGLGSNYMSEQMIAWHKNELRERMFVNLTDGKKIAMPRYYKEKIYTETERKVIAAASKIKSEKINQQLEEQFTAEQLDTFKRAEIDRAAWKQAQSKKDKL